MWRAAVPKKEQMSVGRVYFKFGFRILWASSSSCASIRYDVIDDSMFDLCDELGFAAEPR